MSGFLHFNSLESDLYTLLSIVNAESINEEMLSAEEVQKCLPHAIWPASESIVEQLLIACAVRLRMVEDRFLRKSAGVRYPYAPDEVCEFVVGRPTSADLAKSGVRRASDKIVHATHVSFYGDGRYDIVQLGGALGKDAWQVKLDVPKFAVAGLCLAAQYEDTWDVSRRDSEPEILGENLDNSLSANDDFATGAMTHTESI